MTVHQFVAFGSPHRKGQCVRCGKGFSHKSHCYHHAAAVARRIFGWGSL
jgi:hypothetical protein